MSPVMNPPSELSCPKWVWTRRGLIVTTKGGKILLPIPCVDMICAESFRRVGVPESYRVGDVYSVGSLFKKAKKGLTRLRDNVRKGVAKTGAVGRWVVETEKRVTKVAHQAAKVADKVVRHPAFRASMAALAAASGGTLTPLAGAVELYAQTAKQVEKGLEAAKEIDRGISNPKSLASLKTAERVMNTVVRPLEEKAARGDVSARSGLAAINAARAVVAKPSAKELSVMSQMGATRRGVFGKINAARVQGVRHPPRPLPWMARA